MKLTEELVTELVALLDEHGWVRNETVSSIYGVRSWAGPGNDVEHVTPPPLDRLGNSAWGWPTYRRMHFAELQFLGEKLVFITRTSAAPWVGVIQQLGVTRARWEAYVVEHGVGQGSR